MKVKKSDISIVLLCLTFYEITIIPHYLFLAFKYLVLFWILYQYHKEWRRDKNLLIMVVLYGVVTWLSSCINGMSMNTVVASIMFGIQIVDIFLICTYYIRYKSYEKLVRVIIFTFLPVLIINDILMPFVQYDFSNPSEEYLVGNKFVVSYLHCFVSMLLFANAKIKRRYETGFILRRGKINTNDLIDYLCAIFFFIYSLLICEKVTCSTGVITCVMMFLVIMLPNKIKPFISNGKIMIIAISVINILVLGTYSLLSMPFFENIIYNVLGKSYTWKGRLIIWGEIFGLIREKTLLGYGYYNNSVSQLVGFGNAQNGILKLWIDTGIIGLVLYCLIVWKCFQCSKRNFLFERYPIVAFFYAMIIASIVEINLTHMIVFMAMALFYAESNKDYGGV